MKAKLGQVAAILSVLAALALLPLARWGPAGGGDLFAPITAYRPDLSRDAQLHYRITGGNGAHLDVTLQVTSTGTIAGAPTTALQVISAVPAGLSLPLGLGGGTVRVDNGEVQRATPNGLIRDLAGSLVVGQQWEDVGDPGAGGTRLRTHHTLLGPARLDVAGRHLVQCAVVAIEVSVDTPAAGSPTTGSGRAWYCPGVGLARAQLGEVSAGTTTASEQVELVGAG